MKSEIRIREAAQALGDAIEEGKADGLVIQWPSRAEDLPAIAISETDKAQAAWVEIPVPSEAKPALYEQVEVMHDPELTAEPPTREKLKRRVRDA